MTINCDWDNDQQWLTKIIAPKTPPSTPKRSLQKMINYLDSIAVSVFVVILVEFDKYWDEQACL